MVEVIVQKSWISKIMYLADSSTKLRSTQLSLTHGHSIIIIRRIFLQELEAKRVFVTVEPAWKVLWWRFYSNATFYTQQSSPILLSLPHTWRNASWYFEQQITVYSLYVIIAHIPFIEENLSIVASTYSFSLNNT